jgi:hypothetical protein
MSSIGSVIAQRPYRGKFFTVISTTARKFPTSSVETASPTGATQIVGSTITFPSLATATNNASSGMLLYNDEAFSANTTTTTLAFAVGQELQDMGRYVHVYINSQKAYTLALVQLKQQATGATEGIDGAASTGAGVEGYNTCYVVIENNLLQSNAPGSSGVGLVGVARCG